MNRLSNNVIIIISVILLIIICSMFLFFALANRKVEIYAMSFDEQIKFSLGKYKVEAFNVSSYNGNSITNTPNAKKILEESVLNSSYLYDSYEVYYNNYSCTYYIMLYEGYYFVVWIDSIGQLVIENVVSEFSAAATEFFFTFPKLDITPMENEENYYTWQEIGVNDFAELVIWYSNLKNSYCEINEETKTIKLNCCDANNFRKVTTSFPITIKAESNGLYLSFDSEGFYND